MGTVADVVPLFDENRIFVRHGLARLRTQPLARPASRCCGFAQLDCEGKTSSPPWTSATRLAPRINAAGRLGTARLAVELLTTRQSAARGRVGRLSRTAKPRTPAHRTPHLARKPKTGRADDRQRRGLVLASSNWHPGLLGIVASRLVDQFARPVLMIALAGRTARPGLGPIDPRLQAARGAGGMHGPSRLSTADTPSPPGFASWPELIPPFRDHFTAVCQRHFGDRTLAASADDRRRGAAGRR